MAKTSPIALVHDSWTSVYTVDSGSGDLQETYLRALGGPWNSQDLTVNYHTPTTALTPAAAVHNGYTSVFTIDAGTGHLWETYLHAIGDQWTAQDLTVIGGTPISTLAKLGNPVALYHTGYVSVYTEGLLGDLWETYLPAIGSQWTAQDLTQKYKGQTPNWAPSPLVHYDTSGGVTWTSLFSVSIAKDLQETYLPAIGQSWTMQDLHTKPGTPLVAD